MIVCETQRLLIRNFKMSDVDYVLRQLNEESFIQNITDKKIRDIEGAKKYLEEGPLSSYKINGFGLYVVQLKGSHTQIGMSGLVKREELEHPDLGYAFLPEYWGKGYAAEAGAAVLKYGIHSFDLDKVLAVTLPSNRPSNNLLIKLGFLLKGTMVLYDVINNLYEYYANSKN
ncbi:MAG: GNAT family N-acetyltransferase [Desulfobacterales bacterium]|nr:GNAT family N-acetyltransferase [Desulfobacterales bacterium]